MNQMVKQGDQVTVDLVNGIVTNNTTGVRKEFMPLSEYAIALIEAGGLIPYTQNRLAAKKAVNDQHKSEG